MASNISQTMDQLEQKMDNLTKQENKDKVSIKQVGTDLWLTIIGVKI